MSRQCSTASWLVSVAPLSACARAGARPQRIFQQHHVLPRPGDALPRSVRSRGGLEAGSKVQRGQLGEPAAPDRCHRYRKIARIGRRVGRNGRMNCLAVPSSRKLGSRLRRLFRSSPLSIFSHNQPCKGSPAARAVV